MELGKPPQMCKTDWKSVGDAYEHFSPEKSGKANFLDLKILCRRSRGPETCFACGSEGIKRSMKQAGCGHSFHAASCFDLATGQSCIQCFATYNMTNYQRLFC